VAGGPWLAIVLGLSLVPSATAQTAPAQPPKQNAQSPTRTNPGQLTPGQKFVLDAVKTAVALPQADSQDRLRVLSTAVQVASPIDRNLAKSLWREGVGLESELIRAGQKPAVSMMASGPADCVAAQSFVENLPENMVAEAEQSLIGAVTSCPKQTLDPVSRKLDAALDKNIVAPRALAAVMQAHGTKSPWSQTHFEKMFASLPDPKNASSEAQNLAGVYTLMAGEVSKDTAGKAGLGLLVWLGKLDDTPQRANAVIATAGAMRQALGEEGYRQALQSDVSANAIVQNAGRVAQKIEPAPHVQAPVLEAMRDPGSDQTERLRGLPADERARSAAAYGFAAGVGRNKVLATKYFDLAFAALDDAWESRTPEKNMAGLVQEVAEAAAQTDSVNAFQRAQKLRDASAQAIAMLAVARVVASNGVRQ
jgi:hypothetical protein